MNARTEGGKVERFNHYLLARMPVESQLNVKAKTSVNQIRR